MLIFFLILGLVSSADVSIVLLVTPSTIFYRGIQDEPSPFENTLSSVGARQSYLIGRHLHDKYLKGSESCKFTFEFLTNNSPSHSQTASNINQGMYIPGAGEIVNHTLMKKSIPPLEDKKEYKDFNKYTKLLGDGAVIHYKKSFPVRAMYYENDTLFSPEMHCLPIKKDLGNSSVECDKSKESKEACDEAKEFCGRDINNTGDVCSCLSLHKSAIANGKLKQISDETVKFLNDTCENHIEEVLIKDNQKLMTNKLLINVKEDLNKACSIKLYVISELQMKALILIMTDESRRDLPKYGSMLSIKHDFPPSNKISVELNRNEIYIEKNKELLYDGFVDWVNRSLHKDYDKACTNKSDPKPGPPTDNKLMYIIIACAGILLAAGLGVGGFCLFKKLRRSGVNSEEIEAEREARRKESERKADEKRARGDESEPFIAGRNEDSGETDAFKSIMSKLDSRKAKKKGVKKEDEEEASRVNASEILLKEDES